jgi:voltage-gated potassium channel Kch
LSRPSGPRGERADHARPGRLEGLYRLLFDAQHPGGLAARVEWLVALLILVSLAAITLEQIEDISRSFAGPFRALEWLLVIAFSIEYLLRLATAPFDPAFAGERFPRLRYIRSFHSIVDLLAIVPALLALLFPPGGTAMLALRVLRLLRVLKLWRHMASVLSEFHQLNRHRSVRARLHALLEPTGHSGRLHAFVDNFVILWVLLSVVSVVLQTIPSVADAHAREFAWIDGFAFTLFTLEYAARLYVAPEHTRLKDLSWARWRYARSPGAIIDLLAILPTLLEWLWPNELDLRVLRVFRLIRLLKLTRYTSAAGTLYQVVARERQIIVAAGFVMLLLVVLTASIGYLFEHDAQPDKFENIPQSIYWAVITLASVGYGDIAPVTPMGRALTVVLSLIGIGIFAIPAGLLASAFTDQLRIDRETFKKKLLHAYESGESNGHARAVIAAEAERLHLSVDDIRRLTEEARDELRARREEGHEAARAVVIDPARHPEAALAQLRVIAAQLDLLCVTAGPDQLREQLSRADTDRDRLLALIDLAAQSGQPRHEAPGTAVPGSRHPGN